MRWLLAKDLRILRRSPLTCALLVIYPIVLGLLIGFALQSDSSRPRVAYVNEVPEGEGLLLAGESGEFGGDQARAELCKRVECVDADSREQAEQMVADGEVVGALILPADLVDELRSLTGLNPESPTVDVIVNQDNPLQASLVDDRIEALLGDANLLLSRRIAAEAESYLDLLIAGGSFELPLLGEGVDILGLERSAAILGALSAKLPERGGSRQLLAQVERFATLAGENVDLAIPLLGSLAEPIAVNKISVSGELATLDSFAVAVAVTMTLMLVSALLVAGFLALEREQNTLARVVATTGRWRLVAEKLALGVIAGSLVTVISLIVLTPFVPIAWQRLPVILLAIVFAAAACSAFGAAIGGVAREVRAASLLAVMATIPIALLSLVPESSVGDALYTVIALARALVPFDPALDAITAGLDSSASSLVASLAHLIGLTAAYALIARLCLRRLAA